MKQRMARLSCVALACSCLFSAVDSRSDSRSVSAVQKVIQMLSDLSAQVKRGKAEEAVAFAKFDTWCAHETAGLRAGIARSAREAELLASSAGRLAGAAQELGEQAAKLSADAARRTAEQQAQTAQRARDRAAFLEQERDFSESVDALERAISVLQQQSHDVAGTKAALLQVSRDDRLPQKAKSIAAAFMGMLDDSGAPDFSSYSAPVADAYEFQSGGILTLLKRLRDEFRSKLAQTQKEEINSKHAYDMIVQDLADSISNSQKQAAVKTSEKLGKEEKAAQDKKQLGATLGNKAEDEQTLANLEAECRQKAMSFQEKQNLRDEEIEAIDEALKILSSPEVQGSAQKHLALSQGKSGTALAQIRGASAAQAAGVRLQLRDFLEEAGRRLKDSKLTLLAQRAVEDPFGKVKAMISDMLTRLYSEQNDDSKHEGFCDAELGKSSITRAKLTEDIDLLTAAVDSGKATVLSLAQSIAELSAQVAGIQQALAEAAELRATEKAKNAGTVADAKAAQAAVERAGAVLKDFYAKALTATALVQAAPQRAFGLKATIKMGSPEWQALANPSYDGSRDTGHKEGMQTFGARYEGKQEQMGNGVLALLEVVAADFANLRSDTLASEAASQRAHEAFVAESERSLAVKRRAIALSESDRAAAELRLQEDTKDLKGTEDELLAAERYHANLVPQCIDQGVTFEARTKAREEEIASLKQALNILGSADIA